MNRFARIIGTCAACGGVGACVCPPPDIIVCGRKDHERAQMKRFEPPDFADHSHGEPIPPESTLKIGLTAVTSTTTTTTMPPW